VPTSADTVYLDSSALVKLVIQERESADLATFLAQRPVQISSALARVEVVRAVRAQGPDAVARARQVLHRVHLLRLDDVLLDAATDINSALLRTLDAIHLAAARTLGGALDELVTYDRRMAMAAEDLGLTVVAPDA
jgi:predicted nucleic acid-binding protein